MNKKIEMSKIIKKGNGTLFSGIFLLGIALFFFYAGYAGYKDELDNPIDFLAVQSEESYAKIEVSYMTEYFATYDEDGAQEKVYLVFDKDSIGYIAVIDDETREKLNDIIDYSYNEELEEPEDVIIYGTTYNIDDNLKDLAMDFYNEVFDEDFLNDDNFNEYLGYYYLDTNVNPLSSNLPIILIISGILVVVSICVLVSFISSKKNSKENAEKYREKLEKIEDELNSEKTKRFDKQKVYITDNYLITLENGFNVIEYKDIVWVYDKEYRYRGVVNRTLYVVTNDEKVHTVLAVNITRKTREIYNEINESIMVKTPDVLEGFTKVNANLVKEKYKR